MGTRLQSALHEGIRKERRCCHGLCVIRRRRYPLLYSTVPRSLIGSPVDQAKQSTRWIVAGCQRGDQTPSPIEDGKMGGLVTELRTSSKTVDSVMMLYDRVVVLPSCPVSRCLSLSCIMFPLKGPLPPSGDPPSVFITPRHLSPSTRTAGMVIQIHRSPIRAPPIVYRRIFTPYPTAQ
ncbi:hypothetical protein HD554DRAFT_244470 [Boletus coccyginus]|nr:hypothetical protein HD554DRAFT_244470 [Boletus coccyginus]